MAKADSTPPHTDLLKDHDVALHAEHAAILADFDAGKLDVTAAVSRFIKFDTSHNNGPMSALGGTLLAELTKELGDRAMAHAQKPPAAVAPPAPAHAATPASAPAATTAGPGVVEDFTAPAHSFKTLSGNIVAETTKEEANTLHLIRADARRLSPIWLSPHRST